jgi:CheY-like chemotaxis protein
LIVDDEVAICQMVGRVLQSAGYDTSIAASGSDALQQLATNGPFALLLTDLVMPQMNGDELVRRARALLPELTAMYFTGFAHQLATLQGALWGQDVVLQKGVSVAALREAVSLAIFGASHESFS